jgi:hypothetical protein
MVSYDAATRRYELPPEQAFALTVEDSPAFLPGAFQIILGESNQLARPMMMRYRSIMRRWRFGDCNSPDHWMAFSRREAFRIAR